MPDQVRHDSKGFKSGMTKGGATARRASTPQLDGCQRRAGHERCILRAPMKLTRFTDYSLRVLMYLAARPGKRDTIAQIASSFNVAENPLVKVVHFLGKSGWLSTVRGTAGGMELACTPENIRVGSVVRSTEGPTVLAECFEPDGNCPGDDVCHLRGVYHEAETACFAVLDRYTVADMVINRRQLTRILGPGGRRPRRPGAS